MRIGMIAIGSELLDGIHVDRNSSTFAQLLGQRGLRLSEVVVVGDQIEEIVRVLRSMAAVCDRVLVSGGLGITKDDITREAVATWLGTSLAFDARWREVVPRRVEAHGFTYHASLDGHTALPLGCDGLDNPVGLALGIVARREDVTVGVVPGVPREFRPMAEAFIQQEIAATPGWMAESLTLFGLTELALEECISPAPPPEGIQLGILPHHGPLEVTLRGTERQELETYTHTLERLLSGFVVARNNLIEAEVGALLRAREETLAVAESCTGGLVASLVTDCDGSSQYFLQGAVTYSNQAKMERLGVASATLERFGAVSEETVREMAEGVRASSGTSWGIATSGIAGPGGGTKDKPVGTVHLAVSSAERTLHRCVFYPGSPRTVVKRRAAFAVLSELVFALRGATPGW